MTIQSAIVWQKAWRVGRQIVGDYTRANAKIDDAAIMWALLCEAVRTARSFPAPPRNGYPAKSAMPDAPDEVSPWQIMMAYLQGHQLDEVPDIDDRPPMPSADAISRADAVLHVFHHGVTLGPKKKRAVYLMACGTPPRIVHAKTGYNRDDAKNAKRRALGEMVGFIAGSMG